MGDGPDGIVPVGLGVGGPEDVAAYFQASGITQLVGSALAPDEKSLAGAAPAPPRAAGAA